MTAHTECPRWCEKPEDHDWEDLWVDGPIRFHTWTRTITAGSDTRCGDAIRIEEAEEHTDAGVRRSRTVVLDVEAPTEWDLATAQRARDLLTEAITLAGADWPSQEGQR